MKDESFQNKTYCYIKTLISLVKQYWWIVISGIVSTGFILILNAPTLITNLENLPSDISRIKTKYLGWYHDDEKWIGFWSEFPEGYVDLEEMNLSKAKVGLEITSKSGEIGGIIGTQATCDFPFLSGYLFIDGKVSGSDEAVITAFDYIGGRRQDIARLTLMRSGIVMTVKPIDGMVNLFPQEAKIGRHPSNYPAITDAGYSYSVDDITFSYFEELCEEKQKALRERLMRNNGKERLPVGQLQSPFLSKEESNDE